MKRIITILISVALILSLSACGSGPVTLKKKTADVLGSELTRSANQYASLLQDNIAAADEDYDSDTGFAKYSFNHDEMLSLSDMIKNSEQASSLSSFRSDLINVAFINTTISYCIHFYEGDELYNETLKLLGIEVPETATNLEKSQAIIDYAKEKSQAFLKEYYRRTIDVDSLMDRLRRSDDTESASS